MHRRSVHIACLLVLFALSACGDSKQDASTPGAKTMQEPPAKATAPAPTLYAKVAADGAVNLSKLDAPEALAVSASLATDVGPGVQRLRKTLAAEASSLARDGARSPVVLSLTVDPEAHWRWVQWVVQAGADPSVGIWQVDLSDPRGGKALRVDLPTDNERPSASDGATSRAVAKVFRRGTEEPEDAHHTVVMLDDHAFEFPKGPDANQDEGYWDQMRKILAALRTRMKDNALEVFRLVAPPPSGGHVPYFDVFRLLRMAKDLGVPHLRLEGAAVPR